MKKYIFLNLKRFDIPKAMHGVNSIAPPADWAGHIVGEVREGLAAFADKAEFAAFFPEAHIIPAAAAAKGSPLKVGCQAVYREDVAEGGNFGAFTSLRTAASMAALGCEYTIIGHCEERKDLKSLCAELGGDPSGINAILNREMIRAQKAGLKVLYCVGESFEEMERREEILRAQLEEGLRGVDPDQVVIAYEPLWAIGPGRPVPTAEEIRKVACFVKSVVPCPIVYGGGLKEANAEMIASIPEMDGGLIALTRFTGDIGFYPEEYLRIIANYLK